MRNSPGIDNSNYRHGHKSEAGASRTYASWSAMQQRCSNPKNQRFKDYGGRGITICVRWSNFENFLADMGERPPGLSLERKRVNEGYSPDNCEWATAKAQARNQRSNRLITHDGRTQCLAAWAEEHGVKSDVLWKRLKRHGRMTR